MVRYAYADVYANNMHTYIIYFLEQEANFLYMIYEKEGKTSKTQTSEWEEKKNIIPKGKKRKSWKETKQTKQNKGTKEHATKNNNCQTRR